MFPVQDEDGNLLRTAVVVLVLAWSLGQVCEDLDTAGFLVAVVGPAVPAVLLPAAVFLVAAGVSFATGTSWGTMAILMPLIIPLSWAVMSVNGMADAGDMHILYSAVACCLAGAVWGDHCSPISDTTVLSSIASGCDHIEHVRTQLPYALLVGVVGLLVGTVPAGFGLSPWISIVIGVAVLAFALKTFGRRVEN